MYSLGAGSFASSPLRSVGPFTEQAYLGAIKPGMCHKTGHNPARQLRDIYAQALAGPGIGCSSGHGSRGRLEVSLMSGYAARRDQRRFWGFARDGRVGVGVPGPLEFSANSVRQCPTHRPRHHCHRRNTRHTGNNRNFVRRQEGMAVYRVFEALDELGAIVEEARGVPMTAGCVVPRGDVLELIDDIKDAIPGELDDAQDVLDARDSMLHEAKTHADSVMSSATAESDSLLNHARSEADRILADAKAQADRMVGKARQHSERMVGEAREESTRIAAAAKREFEAATGRAKSEADRLVENGNISYEKGGQEGIKEQQRLGSQTEVVQSANAESARLIDAAHVEADRLRGECDIYVDSKLAEFEEHLNTTLRSVNRGRHQLRTAAGVHDYAQR